MNKEPAKFETTLSIGQDSYAILKDVEPFYCTPLPIPSASYIIVLISVRRYSPTSQNFAQVCQKSIFEFGQPTSSSFITNSSFLAFPVITQKAFGKSFSLHMFPSIVRGCGLLIFRARLVGSSCNVPSPYYAVFFCKRKEKEKKQTKPARRQNELKNDRREQQRHLTFDLRC